MTSPNLATVVSDTTATAPPPPPSDVTPRIAVVLAVEVPTGRLIALDASSGATPGQAVAASCSVPGLDAPVRIAGRAYIDGALHSINNVGSVAPMGPDIVIVSAPLSIDRPRFGLDPMTAVRNSLRLQTALECRKLARTARTAQVVVIEPTPSDATVDGGQSQRSPLTRRRRPAQLPDSPSRSRPTLPPGRQDAGHPLGHRARVDRDSPKAASDERASPMSHIDPLPPQSPDGLRPPEPIGDTHPSNVGLLIEAIGDDHLDVSAFGSFNTESLDRIAARLHKLMASASHLRIDFRNVADLDPRVASLFRQAATTVEAAGGTLDLVGLHASFFRGDTAASEESVHAPSRQRGAPETIVAASPQR